jgi:hypothetical protein
MAIVEYEGGEIVYDKENRSLAIREMKTPY